MQKHMKNGLEIHDPRKIKAITWEISFHFITTSSAMAKKKEENLLVHDKQ